MEKLMELIAEQLHVEVSEVKTDAKFKEDLHADSLDLFELGMTIEDQLGVEIPSEAFAQMQTIGDVAAYVESHQ